MATTMHDSPAYAPCEGCGTPVLRGVTTQGQRVMVDVQGKTYMCRLKFGDAGPKR